MGALVLLFFRRRRIDPVVASGALITTLNDGLSLLLFLGSLLFCKTGSDGRSLDYLPTSPPIAAQP